MLKKDSIENHKGAVGLYLKQVGSIRRLSEAEELEIWIKLESVQEKKSNLTDDAFLLETLFDEEVYLRNKLIKSNLRLVVSIAKRYYNSGVPFIDLIDDGNIGLIEAVKRFDYRRGFKFSTYGAWWIKQSIIKAISNKRNIIRFPMHILRLIKIFLQTTKRLNQKLSREPTFEEIAKEMKLDSATLSSIMAFAQDTASTDSFFKDSENNEVAAFIEDKASPAPHHNAFMQSLRNTIDEALSILDDKERSVIISRFGLDGQKNRTLEETGQELSLTRERVRQIQIKALRKLARANISKELKCFMWE